MSSRLSSIALLVLGASALVCNPAGAWDSRALLSSELAIASSSAMGEGMSVDKPAALAIGSGASTGATNTGDYHEADASAESAVDIDADIDSSESESDAHADVYEAVYEEIPYGDGTVDSAGDASGSDFAATGATAKVVAVMGGDGSASYGLVDAAGDAAASAGGHGSLATSSVDASGESFNVDIEGNSFASTGSMAAGYTSGLAEGDSIAATESQLSFLAVSEVDPSAYDPETGVYTASNGVAVIDGWTNAYGAYSESNTNTNLMVDNIGVTYEMYMGPEGTTDAEASGGAVSFLDGTAVGYGAGSSRSGVSGGIGAGLNVRATAGALDSEVPLAIGVGVADFTIDGGLESWSVGSELTQSTGILVGNAGALTSTDAEILGDVQKQFTSTNNVVPDAMASFGGMGYGIGLDGVDSAVLIEGGSSGASFGVSLTDLSSMTASDAEAEALVTSVGDMTNSDAAASGVANAMSGSAAIGFFSDFGSNAAWTQGSGFSEAVAQTNLAEPDEGYSQASAGAAGAATSLVVTDLPRPDPSTGEYNRDIETYAVGTAEGTAAGAALGSLATTEINYGSMGGSLARAQSLSDTNPTEEKGNTALSATLAQSFVLNDNSLTAQNTMSFGEDVAAAAFGLTSIYTESEAGSETGLDRTISVSDTLTAVESMGAAEGGSVLGSGSLFTESSSLTGAGTVGIGKVVGEEDVLGEAGFATTVGSSIGYGMADVDVPSFAYAEGSMTGIVEFDVVGGSAADSGILANSNKVVGDLDQGVIGKGDNFITTAGAGEAFGGAAFDHSSGILVDAQDTTVQVEAFGNGEAGSGTIALDSNTLATFTALQASDAEATGSGMATGSFDSPISIGHVDEGTYGVEGYATGSGMAATIGSISGGATDETQFIANGGGGVTTASGSAGVFSEGAVGTLDASVESMGRTVGDAGVGLTANDPAIRAFLPSMAAGAQTIQETSLSVDSMAVEESGGESYVGADSESKTEGDVRISGEPGDTVPTIILDQARNYAFSDGGAVAHGSAAGLVTGETRSISEADILSPGESGKYVSLEIIDEDNTALAGGFADTAMLVGGFPVGSGVSFSDEREATFPLRGFARVDTEVGALATDLVGVTAFGIELSDEAPPTIAGQFGGAIYGGVAFADTEGLGIQVPGTDISYEYESEKEFTAVDGLIVDQVIGDGEFVFFDNSVAPSADGNVVIDLWTEDGVLVEAESEASMLADVTIIAEAGGRMAASGFFNSQDERAEGTAVSNGP